MIILAIETCFNRCAACLYDSTSGLVLADEQQFMERGQAEALAPMVQNILTTAAVDIASLARVAVTTGPGTFTGLRIGLSFARAFGLARNIPVVGLDSLRAVALSVAPDAGPALVAHKAGHSGSYYVLRGTHSTTLEIMRAEDLQLLLKSWKGLVLGTGAEELSGQVRNNLLERDPARDLPQLQRLAAFAAEAPPPSFMPEPVYLRQADAKPQVIRSQVMAQTTLRDASRGDIPNLAALHQRSYFQGWSEADLTAMLDVPGTQALMIEAQGHMAGFILLRVVLDEAEILTLAVAPGWRSQGLGAKLVTAALGASHARNISRLLLEVNANNSAAIALYKRCGFAETGRRKAYYTTPLGTADAILMARKIP